MPKTKGSPSAWTKDEFLKRVVKHENNCWELPTNKTRAHLISYRLFNGEIPRTLKKGDNLVSMFVCHTCDNPSCCNPEHLFLGTQKDNNADRAKKNRSYRPCGDLNVMKRKDLREKRRGEGNPMFGRKHTEEAKAKIIAAHTGDLSHSKRPDVRAKLSASSKSVPEVQCEYCFRWMKPWSLARYHGEKCNEKFK